jgi:hypothetical protein
MTKRANGCEQLDVAPAYSSFPIEESRSEPTYESPSERGARLERGPLQAGRAEAEKKVGHHGDAESAESGPVRNVARAKVKPRSGSRYDDRCNEESQQGGLSIPTVRWFRERRRVENALRLILLCLERCRPRFPGL